MVHELNRKPQPNAEGMAIAVMLSAKKKAANPKKMDL
jgi:hypothetical protein